jgi:hypothetical protein
MAMAIRKTQPTVPKKRPTKKPDYLAWLHTLPCVVTGRLGVEAAHLSTAEPWYGHYGRAKGTKAPDIFALPLHPDEHRIQHSMAEMEYWHEYVNPHILALILWAIYSMYDEQEATERASARIYAGLPNGDEMPW